MLKKKSMGYIKLYRSIEEWEWATNPTMYYFWVRLLVKANYETREWQGKTIERGCIITSVAKLASDFCLSVKQVRACLERLVKGKQIVTETTNKWTKITICNYASYQDSPETKGQTKGKQKANERATTKEDNTLSSTNVESKDIIQEEREEKPPKGGQKKETDNAVDHLYSLYPTRCPLRNSSTGKSSKCKTQIIKLLRTHSAEELEAIFSRYVAENLGQHYLMNFSTFLNNLPDYSEPEPEKVAPPMTSLFDQARERKPQQA